MNAPADAVLRRWAAEGLVWLPERGMGYYPVQESPYDAAYWQKYAEYAETDLGRRLNELRLALLDRYAGVGTVCDVGIGCGQFVASLRVAGREAYGNDVNPTAVAWLRERGWWLEPREAPVRTLTFWDSLEHIGDAGAVLRSASGFVLVSLPIFQDARHVLASKHFRRDEHTFYWTRSGLLAYMRENGLECLEHNTMESLAGREDIETFVFRRLPCAP